MVEPSITPQRLQQTARKHRPTARKEIVKVGGDRLLRGLFDQLLDHRGERVELQVARAYGEEAHAPLSVYEHGRGARDDAVRARGLLAVLDGEAVADTLLAPEEAQVPRRSGGRHCAA